MSLKIKDIAEKANVSVATVSRVLNGSDKVSQETREKVMEVIEKYNYQPDKIATSLRRKENRHIWNHLFCERRKGTRRYLFN